jgi:hypothetical protein
MGMIFPEDLAYDARRLFEAPSWMDIQVVHGVQDSALHGLKAIPRVGQGTRHDDAHRIIEIGLLDFFVDVDSLDCA